MKTQNFIPKNTNLFQIKHNKGAFYKTQRNINKVHFITTQRNAFYKTQRNTKQRNTCKILTKIHNYYSKNTNSFYGKYTIGKNKEHKHKHKHKIF